MEIIKSIVERASDNCEVIFEGEFFEEGLENNVLLKAKIILEESSLYNKE